ncbi:MAG: HEAT repeat domain-containing protein [Methanobacterium sp.]|uniref:HEAT repeat domain-containing protein n=1 Tax=Methanobacterium sp. TaxID=2164 RepID=UPI003D646094|nr:HEAT repeat domain-containing protein [Methanobacterium sp.]
MAKFCPGCGNENKDASKFCENCGYDLGSLEKAPIEETKVEIKSEKTVVSETESHGKVRELIGKLEDPNPQVRFNSALELGVVGGSGLDLLHEALISESLYTRWGAAYALGGVKSPESIPYLIDALRKNDHETNINIVKWILHAMGEIGGEEVIDPLLEVIDKKVKLDYDYSVQGWTTRVLGYVGNERVINILKNKIQRDWRRYVWLRAEGRWAIGKIEDKLQDKRMEPGSKIQYANSDFKSLNLTPGETKLLRSYNLRDKDDVGEMMMSYTLLDLIIRGVLTTEQHIKLKNVRKIIGKSYTSLVESCVIKQGDNFESTNLNPLEKEVVSYVKKDKGVTFEKFAVIMDNDRIGKNFRNKFVKYLVNEGYFKGGFSGMMGASLTDKGKETLNIVNEALYEGNDLRIWLKYNPEMAYEYLDNMGGNVLFKRHCLTNHEDIPILTRKLFEAKNHQEILYCYYWLLEGPNTDLTP